MGVVVGYEFFARVERIPNKLRHRDITFGRSLRLDLGAQTQGIVVHGVGRLSESKPLSLAGDGTARELARETQRGGEALDVRGSRVAGCKTEAHGPLPSAESRAQSRGRGLSGHLPYSPFS